MKKIEITAYGAPAEVARCIEAPDVGPPGAGEIVFDVLAFPINPADLSMIRGSYRLRPPLPATPGAECVGRVAAVGVGVARLRPGDLVLNMQRENWAQRRRIVEADAIPLPAGSTSRRRRCCGSTRRRRCSCSRTMWRWRPATGLSRTSPTRRSGGT